MMTDLNPAFDWREVARLVLTSRAIDDLQEGDLTSQGLVPILSRLQSQDRMSASRALTLETVP